MSDASEPDPFSALASRLRTMPIWIFHGAKDDVVPLEDDRRTSAALKAVGNDVRYSELPEANHNAWDPAYAMPELWTWLFAQHR
jgi:predicted peptidase